MNDWYREDLAYIHDIGYSDHALKSASGILDILQSHKILAGLIVDLGCGSGLSAQEFIKANYRVLGIDISQSLINIARIRVPNAEFRIESLFKANIPPCNAVISIGECLNYLFDSDSDFLTLIQLFHRIYNALSFGGVFIFDIIEARDIVPEITTKGFTEGDDWIVLFEKKQEREQAILTRRIITFRKVGEHYRRDDEVHRQRLYKATDVERELRQVGFQVDMMRNYGQYHLLPDRVAFVARKLG